MPVPGWPNFEGAILSRGGVPRSVPMQFGAAGWTLDLDRLFDACGDRTRAIFINTPSNPTGWTASADELRAILEFARKRGIWIIADEIYGRFYYEGGIAPSFQTMREPGDRILFVQTFSKNWAMTGWRMGWLQAPPELGQTIENLIQYNTSGVPTFLQPAGVVALGEGETVARDQLARAAEGRKIVCSAIEPFGNVRFAWPAGAFYLLFGIEGVTSSLDTRRWRLSTRRRWALPPAARSARKARAISGSAICARRISSARLWRGSRAGWRGAGERRRERLRIFSDRIGS